MNLAGLALCALATFGTPTGMHWCRGTEVRPAVRWELWAYPHGRMGAWCEASPRAELGPGR